MDAVEEQPAETAPELETVWLVRYPSGSPHAVFATQALAEEWITANPAHSAATAAEPWHVHSAYQSALRDAESESWDGPGIDVRVMIKAAGERRRTARERTRREAR